MPNCDLFPEPPSFTHEQLQRCRDNRDFTPILFEWYKFVASLGTLVTNIMPESPAFNEIPRIHYHVVMGLLNRCWRLMLSNVALSHQGKFGETTAIIDRCIMESAIKLQWLCTSPTPEKFNRYLATGLKTELELKGWIENAITARADTALPIETRMLRSIQKHIAASGLNEEQVRTTHDMLDLASMMTQIGYDRLMYIVAQKIGSHHVHGTWSGLLSHYLEEYTAEEGRPEVTTFRPRGHDCEMHLNQYMFTPIILLETMAAYVGYVLHGEDAEALQTLFRNTEEEILRVYSETE
jgi:hypothetical protein